MSDPSLALRRSMNAVGALRLRHLPGLALAALLAALAQRLGLAPGLQARGFGALGLAIVLGMGVGHFLGARASAAAGPGVSFARQWLLRAGIVLFGLHLTLQDLAQVGAAGLVADVLMVATTFLLAAWLGTRVWGLDRRTALLVAVGNAVCGVAAVLAAEPVVRARPEQAAIAVATVVVFGTLAIFVVPWIAAWNLHSGFLQGGARGLGIYIGASVHEIAQVVAAAHPLGAAAERSAVITKMVRVMLLAPLLLALSWWLGRNAGLARAPRPRIALPGFALAFIGVVVLNSTGWLAPALVALLQEASATILAMAMAALGLSTRWTAIREAGLRPLLLGLVLFTWLLLGGALVQHLVLGLAAAA